MNSPLIRFTMLMRSCTRSVSPAFTHSLGPRWRWMSTRSPDAPFRMAVIGSGPAGFYTAYRVMNKIPGVKVDMYESLPTPFGLVRYGVAPDHPEVKNCQDKFEEIASHPNFTFVGNTSIGNPRRKSSHTTIPLDVLTRHYDSILFAYGASEDKLLRIDNENPLLGLYSAREFVGWYNGLPDCADLEPALTKGPDAVIIGNGNVALDVARMLLEDVDVLRKTDIPGHVLQALSESKVERVHVVGRRGPMQAAFTIKELRELMKLKNVSFEPVKRDLIPPDVKALPRTQRRLMEVLLKGSDTPKSESKKLWSLNSCLAPRCFWPVKEKETVLESTEFNIMELKDPYDPKSVAVWSGQHIVYRSDLAFRSVGYKSVPLKGFMEARVKFDSSRGHIANDGLGRVVKLEMKDTQEWEDPEVVPLQERKTRLPGMYCSGWVKTGPTGVIASTMADAFITGDAIVDDWLAGQDMLNENNVHGWEGVKSDMGSDKTSWSTDWNQWLQVDRIERFVGKRMGKPREKVIDVDAMIKYMNSPEPEFPTSSKTG